MTRTVKIILCALAVLIAAGVTLYPLLSNRYAEKTKSLIETQYTEAIQQLDESELIAAREAAHEYNTTLVNVTDKAFSKEALIRAWPERRCSSIWISSKRAISFFSMF